MLTINFESAIRLSNIRLAPFKESIYTYLFLITGVHFNNLITLQVELLLISTSYYLVNIEAKIYPALKYLL